MIDQNFFYGKSYFFYFYYFKKKYLYLDIILLKNEFFDFKFNIVYVELRKFY